MQHGNDDWEVTQPPKSTGLIRGAIFGAILLLAIIGSVALASKLFRTNTDASEPRIAEISAEEASKNFKLLTLNWMRAKGALKNAVDAEKSSARKLSETRAKSRTQQTILKEVDAAFTRLASAVAASQGKAEEADDEMAVFLGDSLEELVANAAGNLDTYKANKLEAESKFVLAQGEAERIKSAVEHLKKASAAAKAAALATATVARAADAAQLVVDENEDVLPDTDGSTLLNLRTDFFNEAKAQADSADRSVKAAVRATNVSVKKLEQAEAELADRREILNHAKTLETQSRTELAELAKQLEALQSNRIAARNKAEIAKERILVDQARLEQGKVALAQAIVENEDLKAAVISLEKDLDKLKIKVGVADQVYAEAEVTMRDAQKNRAIKRAATIAGLNSEMHDKLRATLGNLRIENPDHDRFIVPSEALFSSGSAALGDDGRILVKDIAQVIVSVIKEMPDDVDWILRVDGHTDNEPLRGAGGLKDNWELSQARALAVVRYLVDYGNMPPQRLAANGLGEFQPLKSGDSEADRAENRRIELVLVPR